MMQPYDRPPLAALNKDRYHARLVERMAEAVGVDMAGMPASRDLTPDEMQEFIVRCMGCQHPKACSAWLDAHPDGASAPPFYCRNSEALAARPHEHAPDDRPSEPKLLQGSPQARDENLCALIQSLIGRD